MSRNRCYDYHDTVPTDHGPLEGEPRRPLYPRMERATRTPGRRLVAAVLMVAVCAVLALLVVGPAQ